MNILIPKTQAIHINITIIEGKHKDKKVVNAELTHVEENLYRLTFPSLTKNCKFSIQLKEIE
jgi:hypothetical protein